MVVVEVAVVGDLPVRAGQLPLRDEVPVAEAEEVEHLVVTAEVVVDVHGHARCDDREDQTGSLRHRQRRQTHAAHVDVAEVLAVGDADEITHRVVRPVVVRAGEPPSRADSVRHHDRAPVAALVDEGSHLVVGAAGQQHRDVHHGHRLVRVRATQLAAEGEHERDPAEQGDLLLPALLIEVVLDGNLDHLVGLRRRDAGLDVRDGSLRDVDELPAVLRSLAAGRGALRDTGETDGRLLLPGRHRLAPYLRSVPMIGCVEVRARCVRSRRRMLHVARIGTRRPRGTSWVGASPGRPVGHRPDRQPRSRVSFRSFRSVQ